MDDDVGTAAADGQPGPEASLAGLVAARICHDLVGPVGAIGNGLDLVRELGSAEGDDLALIADSAERAAALLKVHRLAFGRPVGGDLYGRRDLERRLAPVIGGGRVEFSLAGTEGPEMEPAAARLAALMALAGRSVAGLGGRVRLGLAPAADLPLVLTVEGSGLRWSPEVEALVGETTAPTAPGEVEFALLPIAARAAGARVESQVSAETVRLGALAD